MTSFLSAKISLIGNPKLLLKPSDIRMCEFKVILKNEQVFEDAVYAKVEGSKVTVRNVLGVTKVFDSSTIYEVDVGKERLVLKASNR